MCPKAHVKHTKSIMGPTKKDIRIHTKVHLSVLLRESQSTFMYFLLCLTCALTAQENPFQFYSCQFLVISPTFESQTLNKIIRIGCLEHTSGCVNYVLCSLYIQLIVCACNMNDLQSFT